MAGLALRDGSGFRLNVGVANKTLSSWRRGLRFVVLAEALGVKVRFDVAGMADRNRAGLIVDVAHVAIRHPEFCRYRLGSLVTPHAVNHFWQSQTCQVLALGYVRVTGCALQMVLVPYFKVRGVRKSQVDISTGDYVRRDHAPFFCIARVLDFFRVVTAPAIGGSRCCAEEGFHPRLGMAGGTLRMPGERCIGPLRVKFMAKRAIRSRVGFRIDSSHRVNVLGVRELEENRSFLVKNRVRQQVFGVRGGERRMA